MRPLHKSLVPPIPAASKEAAMSTEKKLRLNKETIRNLSDENLEQVAGGKRKNGDTFIAVIGVGCSAVCATEGHHASCALICVG
jgi:hypothetical protein